MHKDLIVIDIDGCLNSYPAPLKMWAEVVLNVDRKDSDEAIKRENDFDLLKSTYRHSVLLNHMLPRNGASEVLTKMKNKGYSITLLSARNPEKNSEIKTITENWLKKYNIPYDTLIFTKDKADYINKNRNKILAVIEDEPLILDTFKEMETEIAVFSNDLNSHVSYPHFNVVYSWKEIANLFDRLTATQ
jgi:uncharacterized HAD superfamily protein